MTQTNGEPKETSPLSGKPRGIRRLFCKGFCNEAKEQIKLAIPVFLSQLMLFLVVLVSSIFCGHLGKIELDAVTLSAAVLNITGLSVGLGMTSACDTLMSQTFGSKNMKRVGVILQRGILIMMLCCFPCWAIFINTEQLLLLCKQDPAIARLSQKYIMISMFGLPVVLDDLEPQSSGYKSSAATIKIFGKSAPPKTFVDQRYYFNPHEQRTLVEEVAAHLSGEGKSQLHPNNAALGRPQMVKVALGVEVLQPELPSWGVLDAAQTHPELPNGLGIAANVRIGNALGAGDIEQAKKACKVVLICTALSGSVVASTVLALRNVIGYVFTNDKDVIILVAHTMFLFAPFHLFDSTNVACSGVLRGTGRQKIGAFTNVFGYYLMGLPIGISLMFAVKLGIIEQTSMEKILKALPILTDAMAESGQFLFGSELEKVLNRMEDKNKCFPARHKLSANRKS
ncbi:multidrug and toxin extrusion protein 2-like [Gastrophryne carolinensis]